MDTIVTYVINKTLDMDKLIDSYYNYVRKVVRSKIKYKLRDEDVEEIIEEVFLGVWKVVLAK